MSSYQFNQVKVLVADDSAYMRSIIKTILVSLDIRTINEVDNGAAAFESFRDNAVDLIITDMVMDPDDGIAFTRRVRTDAVSPNRYVPIIMVSGYADRPSIVRARDAGISRFLAKPFSAANLCRALVDVIEDPRQFVEAGDFFGPDRRHSVSDTYNGVERRGADPAGDNAGDNAGEQVAQGTAESAAAETG
jgi:two-component system, chemotaxis family, chemotaxis protein CheY